MCASSYHWRNFQTVVFWSHQFRLYAPNASSMNGLPMEKGKRSRFQYLHAIQCNRRDGRNRKQIIFFIQYFSYFFSWRDPALQGVEEDWLSARNYCRKRCMDSVSLETSNENEWVKQRLVDGKVKRKCSFKSILYRALTTSWASPFHFEQNKNSTCIFSNNNNNNILSIVIEQFLKPTQTLRNFRL